MLVELYAPMIYSRCRRVHRLGPGEAENVGQEVFKAVARSVAKFRRQREGSFRKWLRVIIDNKCTDHFRKQNVVAEGGSVAQQRFQAMPDPLASHEADEGNAELGEKATLMRQAMKLVQNEFSERDWKIFWDIAVEDKDRQDTAQKFLVSDNVVYLAISRIRKRLKLIYEDLLDDDIFPGEAE
jgi:RNA polymerase sigma-70 factor (ECF subfamily)